MSTIKGNKIKNTKIKTWTTRTEVQHCRNHSKIQ